MKSGVLAAIIVVLLLGVGAGAFVLSKDSEDVTNNTTTESSPTDESKLNQTEATASPASNSDQAGPITTAQVALHDNENDCWTIINGSVYDITSYIPRHDGGDNILSACGVDATAFFNGDKTGQAGGTNDHSNDNEALNALEQLKIGDLSE